MNRQIPIIYDPSAYGQKTTLDSIVYTLSFRWNSRAAQWFMDIATSDDVMIKAGIAIVVKWDLLGKYSDGRLPPGTMYAINIENENVDPTETNFGSDILLLYNEAS